MIKICTILSALIVVLVVASCGPQTPTPTVTAVAMATQAPTARATPTATLGATSTPKASPTMVPVASPQPTGTPQPTDTRPPTNTAVSPTDTPAVPTDTPRPTPTEATGGPSLEVQLYALEMADTGMTIADALGELGELTQDPQFGDDNWVAELVIQMVAIQVAHTQLTEISVPAEMADLHELILDATGDCYDAMDYLASGIDDLDADGFKLHRLVDQNKATHALIAKTWFLTTQTGSGESWAERRDEARKEYLDQYSRLTRKSNWIDMDQDQAMDDDEIDDYSPEQLMGSERAI